MARNKLLVLFGLFFIIILFLLWFLKPEQTAIKKADSPSISQSKKTKSTKADETSEQTETDVVSQARETLEEPENQLDDRSKASVLTNLVIATDYLKSVEDFGQLQATYGNRLSLTSTSMLQTLGAMMMTGYQLDKESVEVFSSKADNVYQFVFTVSKSSDDRLSFVGNYVPSTEQIEVVSMKGYPSTSDKAFDSDNALYN
ncbi:hypothetical protein AALH12_07160 [Streptococcus ferus]|uniref:hypothetical protein n=1 Tax=Streptococcus ferus TaxID=1345 RepID=UPI0035199B28